MAYTRYKTVSFGAAYGSLATVAYQLTDSAGAVQTAWTTTGVSELIAASGIYGATISLPESFRGRIEWRTASSGGVYAAEEINPEFGAEPFDRGTVQASPSPTATVFAGDSALSSANSAYYGSIAFLSGANAGISRQVQSYVGTTRLITCAAFPVAPSSGDLFILIA